MRIEAARAGVASCCLDRSMTADLSDKQKIVAVFHEVAEAGVAKNLCGQIEVGFVTDLSHD